MDGQWAELHAAPLTGISPSGQHVAVGVRPAPPTRIRALLTRAYQLSDREREVARLVLDGLEVADIAAALYISPHTVTDHLKAILGKTRSQAEQPVRQSSADRDIPYARDSSLFIWRKIIHVRTSAGRTAGAVRNVRPGFTPFP